MAKTVDSYHFNRQPSEATSVASAEIAFAASAKVGWLATMESTRAHKTRRNLC